MKRYVPILIGIVALCAVLYIGSVQMNKEEELTNEENSTEVTDKSFQGSVMRVFEGENTLLYGFDLPSTATATVSMQGALVKVVDVDVPVFAMYFSYEGGRGYTPAEYVSNVITPKVSGITQMGTTTIGMNGWTVVESKNSVWHVASASNGNWLIVVENVKANSEKTNSIIESLSTK